MVLRASGTIEGNQSVPNAGRQVVAAAQQFCGWEETQVPARVAEPDVKPILAAITKDVTPQKRGEASELPYCRYAGFY